jgi:hypothetical protein
LGEHCAEGPVVAGASPVVGASRAGDVVAGRLVVARGPVVEESATAAVEGLMRSVDAARDAVAVPRRSADPQADAASNRARTPIRVDRR